MASPKDIKRAQKESVLLRLISQLFLQAEMDDPKLRGLTITRVALSPDKGLCTVYFYTPEGEAAFNEKLSILKLYKPSMRKAMSQEIPSRYTAELVFRFDDKFERQAKLEALIDSVGEREKP